MAKKTNCTVNGKEYFRICRKVGKRLNKKGLWVDNYKNFYGSCKSEAEASYQKYMERKEKGIVSDMCTGELIDEWIESIFKNSSLANGTKYGYIRSYKKHFKKSELAGRMIDDITPLDLQNYYNKLHDDGVGIGTIKQVNNILKHFYKYADLNGISRDITASVNIPKDKKKKPDKTAFKIIDVWKDEDLKKVISALNGTTLRFLVVLAANTGARFSELLALTYDDIKDNMLYISKQVSEKGADGKAVAPYLDSTKSLCSNRVIPLSAAVLMEFEAHKLVHKKEMLANGYRTINIFTTSSGNYYYRRNVSRALKRLYERIGVPYHRFHAYRHTFGTNLSRAGVPIEETCRLMGHENINVTMKYYINVEA